MDRVANLMIITDNNRKHYIVIKSLSRLLTMQNSKHKESPTLLHQLLAGICRGAF